MNKGSDKENGFDLGRVVVVRRGKDAGIWAFVVGVDPSAKRVVIADGALHPASHPKPKNPLHLQKTRWVDQEVVERLHSGKKLDDGWLQAKLLAIRYRRES